jgi:hypothetical protein
MLCPYGFSFIENFTWFKTVFEAERIYGLEKIHFRNPPRKARISNPSIRISFNSRNIRENRCGADWGGADMRVRVSFAHPYT